MLFWHIDGHHKLKRFLSQNYALAVFIAICVYFPIFYLIVVVGTCLCIKGLWTGLGFSISPLEVWIEDCGVHTQCSQDTQGVLDWATIFLQVKLKENVHF